VGLREKHGGQLPSCPFNLRCLDGSTICFPVAGRRYSR
jgi:hypothetical protein